MSVRKKRRFAPDDLVDVIAMREARRATVRAAGGGQVIGIELKKANIGIFAYKVKVVYGGEKFESQLDAVDGNSIGVEGDRT